MLEKERSMESLLKTYFPFFSFLAKSFLCFSGNLMMLQDVTCGNKKRREKEHEFLFAVFYDEMEKKLTTKNKNRKKYENFGRLPLWCFGHMHSQPDEMTLVSTSQQSEP